VENVARRYLETKPAFKSSVKRKRFTSYKQREAILQRGVKQTRCAIGRDAYPLLSQNRIPFFLLNNILGGPGMNSRLSLSIREKYGLVYAIDAQYLTYADTGMFSIYFGTEPKQVRKCMALVRKEMDKLCDAALRPRELASAKEQIKGQLAMSEENNQGLMIMMGRAVIDLNRVPSLEEVYEKINDVDATQLQRIACEMFDENKLSSLIIEPKH
jgi:predicted Zn-dependent peptidase